VSNLPSLPRRLTVLIAGLAACLAGMVATSPEPQAAPTAAPVAVRAAPRTPDGYTPKRGVLFNTPTGTRAQQYRLFTHINRSINSSPPGSVIRIAVFSFADLRTADNLIRAHRRGVDVKLVFDDHTVYDAERKLQRVLGANPRHRSFAVLCRHSCRSTGGAMHGKVYLFGRAGAAKRVTMVGSNNMTSHNAERQWSDLLTLTNNRPMYTTFRTWFGQLKWDRPVAQPRIARLAGQNLALITPQDPEKDGDPALRALAPVACPPAPGRTRVLISAHAWYGPRGMNIANRVAHLAEKGCVVKVFYGDAFGTEIHKKLQAAGVRLRTSHHKGIITHQKLLIVRGAYGGNGHGAFVWTGSHNWSPLALKLDDVILRSSNLRVVNAYTRHFSFMFDHA
jgi:hypothetical protein